MIWRLCPECRCPHNPAEHDPAWPFLCGGCGAKLQFEAGGRLKSAEEVFTMPQLYLWSGIGEIEDLDNLDLDDALRVLREKKAGDWTLWYREGFTAKLVGVHKTASGEIHVFVPEV